MQTGYWKNFRQERPPLGYVWVEQPFVVREAKGTISSDDKPLAGAVIEIELPNGLIVGFYSNGTFNFPRRAHFKSIHFGVPPGTYLFKATKDGFYSTMGIVIVSDKAPKQSVMAIELKPGPVLSFCTIATEPEKYDGQEVTVAATYHGAMHGSYLSSDTCADSRWNVRIAEKWTAQPGTVLQRDALTRDALPVSVVVRGVFRKAKSGECFGQDCLPFEFEERELMNADAAK
jgi:hypothetical protein